MRATALGFATEYAVAIKESDGETTSPADIVAMAEVFLEFLMADAAATGADGAVNAIQQDAAAQERVAQEAPPEPEQPEQAAPTAPPVEQPPPAPLPPPEAPLPESPAPATDQPLR
jgi:type IV secretory pathway VirB10-like protein